MTSREDIERTLREAYAARQRGDLDALSRIFAVLEHQIVSMLIDGSKAAVQWRAKMRSAITGETVETDLCDLIEMEDGRVKSFFEFCDTALAARMMKG